LLICKNPILISFHSSCDKLILRYLFPTQKGVIIRDKVTCSTIMMQLNHSAWCVSGAAAYPRNMGSVHRWCVQVRRVAHGVDGHVKYLATPTAKRPDVTQLNTSHIPKQLVNADRDTKRCCNEWSAIPKCEGAND
jgi:hypothetical protein